mmetsp:Transcript_9640/g.18924  ORF Transcript_9640/g.18924 Transcript_9640/m.18924 type:complete len:82 (-) Transcript_9640:133-378(-)
MVRSTSLEGKIGHDLGSGEGREGAWGCSERATVVGRSEYQLSPHSSSKSAWTRVKSGAFERHNHDSFKTPLSLVIDRHQGN